MKKIAHFISSIGNPVVIALFYGVYLYFKDKNSVSNPFLPLVFILIILIPTSVYVYVMVKNKAFNNYDVSNQIQRRKINRFIIILLSVLLLILYILKTPYNALSVLFIVLLQLSISYFVNFKVKISMHTSTAFLFAYLFYPVSQPIAIFLFISGFFIGASRLVLKRHKFLEVMSGFLLGNIMGFLYLFIQTHI